MTFWCLYCLIWTDSTSSLKFHSGIWESVACWVNQRQSKGRDANTIKDARGGTKLCNINQTDQTKTWKKTCIEFKKYESMQRRLWDLWNVLRFSFHKNDFFVGTKSFWKPAQRPSLILPVCIVLTNYLTYDAFHDLKQFIKCKK